MDSFRCALLPLGLIALTSPVRADGTPASSTKPAEPAKRTPSKALPLTLLTIGGAAVVAGVVALAIDEDPESAPRGQQQSQYYIESAPGGVAGITTGVILAGIGGYLLWSQRSVTTAPTLEVRSGGAVAGVTYRW